MPLILNIDTSTEHASICLANNSQCIKALSNDNQKEHASWLHPAILRALAESGKQLSDLDAVGITTGPGSYTGLRVGMAAAKGLCYALNIPLIGTNTLDAMALMGVEEDVDYICPMIDARRMEVFTALYNKTLEPVLFPSAIILDENSFSYYLGNSKIVFLGNGISKFEKIVANKNAYFKNYIFTAVILCSFTYNKFNRNEFSGLEYTEPFYLKGF
jgi:tRNA threonylcarbamoyladenosine biosynthesis protein TsaB